MDINRTIQFIKNSRGLYLDKKIFYKIFILFPIIFVLVMMNAQELGSKWIIISAIILLLIFITNLFCLFALIKHPLLKYKLFLRPCILLNCVVPVFYISCLTFYDVFGLKNFFLYYLLPFLVISFAFVIIGFSISSKKKRQKPRTSYPLLFGALLGLTLLISGKTNGFLAEKLNENTHFLLIAVLVLLINCFAFSIVFLDLLRYCYFIKLEKAEIVTEDILKHEG